MRVFSVEFEVIRVSRHLEPEEQCRVIVCFHFYILFFCVHEKEMNSNSHLNEDQVDILCILNQKHALGFDAVTKEGFSSKHMA